MKLCQKAQGIKDDYARDQRSFQMRADREPKQAGAMSAQVDGSRRAMVRAVHKHMARCPLCG